MNRNAPPYWMERLLHFLLARGDRETVSGDLHEEFLERKIADSGSGRRATMWYLRQVVSFIPARVRRALAHEGALAVLCGFTALCGVWLGAMDLKLRHPGYAVQMAIAGGILLQAVLTLAALRFRRSAGLRAVCMAGSLVLLFVAAKALLRIFGGAEFEGYVLVIALALIAEAVLTFGTLPYTDDGRRSTA